MDRAMAHSCQTMRLPVREPLQVNLHSIIFAGSSIGANCGFERTGIMSMATINRIGNVSRSRQIVGAIRLPGVSRWEGTGLRAPQLPKAEIVRRPVFRDNASKVVCSLPVGPSSVQIASTMFTFGTAFVVPFYTAMIFAPKWKWTKRLVESDLPFVVLGAMYIYLLALSWTPETLNLMFASKYWLPELPGITRMFSSTITVASAWIHLLVADLFCGRYVFLDGLQHKVETRHSLVLCLMMCPIGIVSHVVTKVIMSFARRIDGENTTDMGKVLA
ncbi:hypothetical protein M758_4G265300 [Ceratodon purpureus]|uniref:Uncharacterized protein n=1 Tax=Ceratodon purpureus TaxID=3225 RepID=A0A8T0IEU6_CERPU|nr:hypothetical protein KC19_4G251800 [Ceratodon purpureus]KAG0621058.1 hypothetical protein M758_4G265300 [Ceratodon purpureus]